MARRKPPGTRFSTHSCWNRAQRSFRSRPSSEENTPSDRSIMSYPKTLKAKVALVVGGARGIGAAAGRLFAHAGAHVAIAITYRPGGRSETTAAEVVRPGSGHVALSA